jgi:hypothetical protein
MRYGGAMRTTLDLDERVLAAARARARQHRTTLGAAVSDLALAGLASETPTRRARRRGLVLLPPEPGHIVTDEMVADALADE